MLKTLKERHFPGVFDRLGEEGMSQADLMVVLEQFFAALYRQPGWEFHGRSYNDSFICEIYTCILTTNLAECVCVCLCVCVRKM